MFPVAKMGRKEKSTNVSGHVLEVADFLVGDRTIAYFSRCAWGNCWLLCTRQTFFQEWSTEALDAAGGAKLCARRMQGTPLKGEWRSRPPCTDAKHTFISQMNCFSQSQDVTASFCRVYYLDKAHVEPGKYRRTKWFLSHFSPHLPSAL